MWKINDDCIQKRLLSETSLTFESALSIAQAMECVNKNVQDLQAKVGAMSCNAVRGKREERARGGPKRIKIVIAAGVGMHLKIVGSKRKNVMHVE